MQKSCFQGDANAYLQILGLWNINQHKNRKMCT